MKTSELADILNLETATIYGRLKRGTFPLVPIRIPCGQRETIRWDPDDVDRLLVDTKGGAA